MAGLYVAFEDYNFAGGIFSGKWVGLKYFSFIFHYPDFYRVFRNTLIINLCRLVFSFPVPIILALLINEVRNAVFKRGVQSLVYLPHFISWVIFGGIIIEFLSPSEGIVNAALKAVGMKPVFFMTQPHLFRGIVVISDIWKNSGWGTIIFLAALSGVSVELYDSAVIDGASRFQQTRYITIPSISATIVVVLLLQIGRIMDLSFEQIYVLYNPTVYSVGDVISTYVYRIGIGNARFSMTTAIGLFQSLIGLVLITIANFTSRKLFDQSIW